MVKKAPRYDLSRIDRPALDAIAARAIPRERLKAEGYHSLYHSSDLFPHGYRVRHWIRVRGKGEVLEYLGRTNNTSKSDLPRLTASCYAEQVEIHKALGINLVPPGCPWSDYRQAGLFDDLLKDEGRNAQ